MQPTPGGTNQTRFARCHARGGGWGRCAALPVQMLLLLVLPGGCTSSLKPDIQSPDAGERILGIRQAGEHKDRTAVPLLVDRLEDEDEAVRFYAILALDKITGQRLGYDYTKPAAERLPAIERWRRYVRGEGRSDTAASPADGGKQPDAAVQSSRLREPEP